MHPKYNQQPWPKRICCQRHIRGVVQGNGTMMASAGGCSLGGHQCSERLLRQVTIVVVVTFILLWVEVDCQTADPNPLQSSFSQASQRRPNSAETSTSKSSSTVGEVDLSTSVHKGNRTLGSRSDRRHQRSTAAYDGTSQMTNPTSGHRRNLRYRSGGTRDASVDRKNKHRVSGTTFAEPLRNTVRDPGQVTTSRQRQHLRRVQHHDDEDDEADAEDDGDIYDDDDDDDDDPMFGFQLTSSSSSQNPNHGVRSVPSMLALATSQSTEPRDKMLKSSKDALIVTKKNYLKKDWCKTEPLIQRVREAGCITMKIVNRFCYGQCNSFYIPKNAKMDMESTAFKSCSFCKPKRYRWITITLHCPGRSPPYKRKRIQRIKKCKCISEILQ